MNNNKNVCSEVVSSGFCAGCGVCAGVCPQNNLEMRFNELGEYNPFEPAIGKCIAKCNVCLKICPFYDNEKDEDAIGREYYFSVEGIKHNTETGYYLHNYVGYSSRGNHRINGTSGGMLTWTLENLLNMHIVDAVVCVKPSSSGQPFFDFTICNSVDEIRLCSRSCYYPVEISSVIRDIMVSDKSYAIVGLPCVCKAIRLAMSVYPILKKRIKYLLGLVCGQGKSSFFLEYLVGLSGVDISRASKISFRVKDEKKPASSGGYISITHEGHNGMIEQLVDWHKVAARPWLDRYFTLHSCDFCDDVYAECADAAFMDAWLQAYSDDWKGHSIVLIRNPSIADIYKDADPISLAVNDIPIDKVIESQYGALNDKRRNMKIRMDIARRNGIVLPKKRDLHYPVQYQFARKQLILDQLAISMKLPALWKDTNGNIEVFHRRTNAERSATDRANLMISLFRYPNAILRKIL